MHSHLPGPVEAFKNQGFQRLPRDLANINSLKNECLIIIIAYLKSWHLNVHILSLFHSQHVV